MYGAVKGFSLIEVLVALVILTIGLIGIFNLHLVAKQGSYESFQQTQAAYIAHDMVNRIKLNSSELKNYYGTFTGKVSDPPHSCNASVPCTPGQIKTWDLYQLQNQLVGVSEKKGTANVGGLDSAVACIGPDANNILNIVLTWRGIRKLSDGATNQNAFVKACGTKSDRRRVFSLQTVIL